MKRFWSSRYINGRVVLTNVDDETLVLTSDGAIVWLPHQVH